MPTLALLHNVYLEQCDRQALLSSFDLAARYGEAAVLRGWFPDHDNGGGEHPDEYAEEPGQYDHRFVSFDKRNTAAIRILI